MYGPVVLAGELGTKGMPNDVCASQSAHSGALDPPVPVLLVEADQDPSSWLKRVPGETLRFQTVGVGKPNDVTLIPVADLHHQRYTVYWETMAIRQHTGIVVASHGYTAAGGPGIPGPIDTVGSEAYFK
jgi:hypothetical protein